MILAFLIAILQLRKKPAKNSGLQQDLNPWPSIYFIYIYHGINFFEFVFGFPLPDVWSHQAVG